MLNYRHVTRFLARSFAHGLQIDLSPKATAAFAEAVDVPDWRARPVRIVQRDTGALSVGPSLMSEATDWVLSVTEESIDLMFRQVGQIDSSNTLHMTKAVPFSEFLEKAALLLPRVMEHFKVTGHRIAAVQEGALALPEAVSQATVRERLIHTPASSRWAKSFEWDWRLATRVTREFGELHEATNTILAAKWVEVNIGAFERFDAISSSVDVNTLPTNKAARFSAAQAASFFRGSTTWHEDLCEELAKAAQVPSWNA